MAEEMDLELARAAIRAMAAAIREHAQELTDLDAAIGDADHGTNMDRGFQAALARLDGGQGDLGGLLRDVAMALISTVGGASGPLYGTAFLRASTPLAGRSAVSAAEVEKALAAAVEGVRERGGAAPGEKTMVDALVPALERFHAAVEQGAGLARALAAAAEGAWQGARQTVDLVATKGRASYLGERSRGHQDPGATSSALLLEAAARALAGEGERRAAGGPGGGAG